MSKSISSALEAHFGQSVTTLCTCWILTRTDTATFYFTDHDKDIVFGGQTYTAATGYNRTAVVSDQKMSVDNMEIFGILSADSISEHELRNGVYDYASVEIFVINWSDLTQGKMTIRKGRFGEVVVTPTGSFKTELRGLTQALAINFGQTISAQCRADLGDSRCKLPIEPPEWIANQSFPAGSWIRASNLGTLPNDPAAGIIFNTTNGGTSGATQPAWSGVTNDNGIVWTPYNSFTKQGVVTSVISRKQVMVSGLLIPQSRLYGPNANALGVTTQVTIGVISSGGFPLGAGYNVVTCDVRLAGSNIMHYTTDVPGGSGLVSNSGDESAHITLSGPLEVINAVLTQGLYWTNTSSYTDVMTITASDIHGHTFSQTIQLPVVAPYYPNATMRWVSGPNSGRAMEVFNYSNDVLTTMLSFPYMPQVGDAFRIFPGCDKLRVTCVAFGNAINFHGEPDLPGQDFLFAPNLNF